ncbi:bifunctional diaminohydroxyphosphoribosylaminopyrimidine deaminase/5-amino-6-(5-phosphoribosylamino)uracil reductase RibD [Anaerotardibacter muris]|uniref:bifunctional diaminohydroxyphosphoribosylaminopyrimidine deaminase/5-amino-6-(5-phosphoribosylamino)uracil reductase RibD n=1 Tax=Anaerotardibacter muris TaxID=2941505 RepID=UPI002040DCB3|nr:bifunctional diaminohydroxyphosphoribosylaminopyrimidine deaminase/5-amino-6-(5-phosphoribosylamino)uracil reductase RibD [Anaerotardibacter muris]
MIGEPITDTQLTDERFMARALELAKRGAGWTNPNPMVGAVVVKDGRIIGEGWHTAFGRLHAEREALAACTEDPTGATIYVTLEPCCHWGKTPPCTEAIIEAKLARVVVGAPDPNPLVAGQGFELLRQAGIEVTEGVLLDECYALNEVFFHYIRTKLPFMVVKYAMTLDGKIATKTGASRWITSDAARAKVHEDRHRFAAIMVGIGTVLADDPELTCRIPGRKTKNPLRAVIDSKARIPLDSRIVASAKDVPTVIAVTQDAPDQKVASLEAAGCEVFVTQGSTVDLQAVLTYLGAERNIDSVLVEGGATLLWSVLSQGLANRIQAYIAPKIFGGSAAPSPVQGSGVALPSDAFQCSTPHVTQLGEDILIECEVKPCSLE